MYVEIPIQQILFAASNYQRSSKPYAYECKEKAPQKTHHIPKSEVKKLKTYNLQAQL